MKLNNNWAEALKHEFEKDYMQSLQNFLRQEVEQGKTILPPENLRFNALNSTPPEKVKVVILGQDPYPTPGHAHGLCFSVEKQVQPIPKSLINIYKELQADLNIENKHGNLQSWANQGVLLLNSVLSVESGLANSHQGKGWERLTDKIISVIGEQQRPVIFVLWGAYAQKKGKIIDENRHMIIRSPHPSPLSAYRGFFGSKPFSKINRFLLKHGEAQINWQV